METPHPDDAQKLRLLADWFDARDKEEGTLFEDDVQKDLRRIADYLESQLKK